MKKKQKHKNGNSTFYEKRNGAVARPDKKLLKVKSVLVNGGEPLM